MTVARKAARRALMLTTAVTLSFTFVLGCSLLKKKKPDPGDDSTENAPTVTVTGTGAKNEKDVLRYGTETKLDNEPGVIGKDITKAKTFPGSGQDVATLTRGTAVVKIARFFNTGVLVIFTDPTTSDGSKLMGWIPPEAIAAPGAAASATAVATGPRVAVPFDAGAKLDASVAIDAGAIPPAAAGLLQTFPTNGKCPSGMTLFGPVCRRPCVTDAQCPKSTFCTTNAGPRTCSATK